MEEVRSYWQVASISHFCTIFGKPFKLPAFEPEELEQAFILEVPAPPSATTNNPHNNIIENHNNNNSNSNTNNTNHRTTQNSTPPTDTNGQNGDGGIAKETEPGQLQANSSSSNINNNNGIRHELADDEDEDDHMNSTDEINDSKDREWLAPRELIRDQQEQAAASAAAASHQQAEQEQQELHLLVKLAIALLKPHFNCKISHANWENYLRRIVDSNWVELEHHPSPFRIPLISQDGVELTKNLTFNELPLSDKIDLFYALCDYRLWCEDAADAIKDFTLEELRLESIGKDSHGYEYWYFSGTRIFRENRELSQDIILRKKRIKELEYSLIELEKTRISREQEEKRKAELERSRQLAAEAREARLAAKKQQEETSKRKKQSTPILPPRTGLRERRSSATSNNNDSQQARTPTTRSKIARQQPLPQEPAQTPSAPKATRSSTKNSTHNNRRQEKSVSPDLPKKSPEEECRDELKRLAITSEDRAEAWCIQCESLEEWESFATKFEKTKSINEKYLSAHVNEHLLPKIRNIYAKRAAEIRRKEKELLFSLSSRRVSTRIISKRAQEEEEERQAQLHEAEMRRKKIEAEHRLRAELEREMRARQNRTVINGGTSSTCSEDGEDCNARYNLRRPANSSSDDFGGIIHPDNLSEFYEALELVVDTVRTSKHAWPFVDPVPETVPGYYDLITEPMDLRKLRTKIEFREYKCLIELEKDFQILVNNCERFNGPKNVYTKMVYKLWKSFKKNVRLYLQRDLTMDEYETFVYPPQPPLQPQIETQTENYPQDHHEIKQESEPQQQDAQDQAMELDNPAQDSDHTHDQDLDQIQNQLQPQPQPHVQPENQIESKVQIQPQLEPQVQTQLQLSPKVEAPEPKSPTPELITEEIIIDSYDVPCPDDNFFIWPQ